MISPRSLRVANAINDRFGIARALSPFLCHLAKKRATETITVEGHRDLTEIPDSLGWGEVIGWRRFDDSPVPETVQAWYDSPAHHDILANRDYPVIGAHYVASGDRYYLCAIVTTGLP